MVIIKLSSGLGNQLFQYALYFTLNKNGAHVKIDTDYYNKSNKDNRKFLIEQLFDIKLDHANVEEKKKLNLSKFYAQTLLNLSIIKNKFYYNGYSAVYFNKNILNIKNGYLNGYWQNLQYFSEFDEELKKSLCIKNNIKDKNNQYVDLLTKYYTVAIHVRRGDYINNNYYYNLSESNYYKNAVLFFDNKFKNIKFLYFSDDINWVKNNLKLNLRNSILIENESCDSTLLDFELMTRCNSIVIANSTYSWWAAWLNSSKDKIVISPNIWFKNNLPKTLIPNHWLVIPH